MIFGFGRTKPPLTAARRGQIECRMRFLVGQLTLPMIQQSDVVVDVSHFVPSATAAPDDLSVIANRIADHMKADISGVALEIVDPGEPADVHQIGEQPKIRLQPESFGDVQALVTTLAHEISHHRLRQFDRGEMPDQGQWLTELATLCTGFAVFVCNSSVKESCCSKPAPSVVTLRGLGYLTAGDLGYAAALLARLRGELDPPWGRLLRADAQGTFKQAMKSMPPPCTMILDATTIPDQHSSLAQLAEQIVSTDESIQFLAAEQLGNRHDAPREAFVPALIQMLRSRDEQVVLVAAETLRSIGPAAGAAAAPLEHLLGHRVDAIAASAGIALMAIDPNQIVFEHVGELLEERWSAAIPLASALGSHGHEANAAAPSVCRRLVTAMRRTEDDIIDALAACLHLVHPTPMVVLESTISNDEILDWLKDYLGNMERVE